MDDWRGKSSSKELHEAIKLSLNSINHSNLQVSNSNNTSKQMDIPGGHFKDEDLERALKLSLNPDEQSSQEQQEFILACKASLGDTKYALASHNVANVNQKENTSPIVDLSKVLRHDDVSEPKYSMSPTSSNIANIFAIHNSPKNTLKPEVQVENKDSITVVNKNISEIESLSEMHGLFGGKKAPKSGIISGSELLINDTKTLEFHPHRKKDCKYENSSQNESLVTMYAKSNDVDESSKKKRKAPSENDLKQKSTSKPIPLAQAAANVKEAPVLSIQEIQEEERQLQEAILKSKQDILEIESGLVQNSQPLASSPERSKSPSHVNCDKKNIVSSKDRSDQDAPACKNASHGRVSVGAAINYIEDEEKQLREAIERSKQELLLNGSDESNNYLGVMKAQPMPVSHETRLERDLTSKETDARLNDSLVKKMSEEEQIRYALQISSKQVSIAHPKPDIVASSTKTSFDLSHNQYENKIKHSSMIPNKSSSKKDVISNRGQRRTIVIDGCNVAYSHGRHDMFSAQGLKIVYDEFIQKGWQDSEIHIFVKPSRMTEKDRELCDSLEKIGVLHWTPKRRVGHQQFTSDDDDMILEYARKKGGVIVTRDQYRDSYDRCPEFKEVIEKRLLQFNFINDDIIFPRDPLGKSGPSLEQFLRF